MPLPPSSVVKFYGNTDFALECIEGKQIAFVPARKLNDPFDPNFQFPTDFKGYSTYMKWVSENRSPLYNRYRGFMTNEKFDQLFAGIKEDAENMINNCFVFSTCGVDDECYPKHHPKDNLYMWGHYANGHKGVAIEFDPLLLANAVLNKKSSLSGSEIQVDDLWFKIEYVDVMPKISCEVFFDYSRREPIELHKIINRLPSLKSKFWEKEREWRLGLNSDGEDERRKPVLKETILDNAITAMYLGCRMDDDKKNEFILKANLRFPNAQIYKAFKKDGEFALDFKEISP